MVTKDTIPPIIDLSDTSQPVEIPSWLKSQKQSSMEDASKQLRLPSWLKQSKTKSKATKKLSQWLEKEVPNSICQEAKCPNRGECFEKGVLTFL